MSLRLLSRPASMAAACVVTLIVIGSLAAPDQAAALPSPTDLIPGMPSIDPSQWVVDGFKAVLKFIFGDQLDELGRNLINLLLAVPLLTDEGAFRRLNNYRDYVTFGAWAILGLSFVVSSIRYWLSSYSGSGAYQALTGFVRTCAAVALLLLFPVVFDQVARAINAFTSALVVNPLVGNALGKSIGGVLDDAQFASGGIAMLIGVASAIMMIVLLVIKVIITALLAVLYVASPVAIALWPVEELSWGLTSLLQAMVGLLAFPVLWALCFGTFAMLSADALFPGDHGNAIDAVLAPLVGLAALIIAFKLPNAVLSQALKAGVTPNFRPAATFVKTRVVKAARK